MRKYRNKYNEEEVKLYSSRNNPSYQITRKYAHKEFPTGYENAKHISKKMDYGDPNSKYGKISSRSEKYYTFYTESSSPKVNFNSKNTSKKYKNKRSITPGRNVQNNNFESKSHNNLINNDYISELREEYSNPILNNRVNIRKKVYRGNKTPQPYRTNEYQGNNEEEELLENYGYHETKNIKDKGHKKYESITHITGYSNLIPLNRLKQCGRIESYNYNELNEQENKPKLINAIERVRELQKGKREYDEFMRKLGSADEDEDKIENYKREQMRQHEIREEKIKIERMRQERIKEEQIKRDKLREQKLREEQMRNERIRQEKIRMERKRKEDELMKAKKEKDKIKQEEIRQIKIREEILRQNKINQEKIKLERQRQEKIEKEKSKNKYEQKTEYKRVLINTETSGNARSDSVKKLFKAHAGKYKYKDNINEEINNYRNNTNYNKELNNTAKKETIYKNLKKKESTKSYSKLPIKINISNTNSYTRNNSYKNLKTKKDYQIKTNKTTKVVNSIISQGRKNSYRSNNTSINTEKNISINKSSSNYTKNHYTLNSSISNNYPNKSNNYKRRIKIAEKTVSLNYPNPHIKVDTYGPNYSGEQYHHDYVNIENVSHGKIAKHIHTGISKDGQYLINMTSSEKIQDENELYELPEKNVEEIISTVREKKKNLGDNYAFYESKHLQKPDNSSYTIHKRFGERTIYGKEKYKTRKIRHYTIKSGEEGKYLNLTDDNNYYNDEYNGENNMVVYEDCNCRCTHRNNDNIVIGDDYENVNFNYSPDSPEGQEGHEEEYENRVEEYNYESY